jgi:hypothetical protein
LAGTNAPDELVINLPAPTVVGLNGRGPQERGSDLKGANQRLILDIFESTRQLASVPYAEKLERF